MVQSAQPEITDKPPTGDCVTAYDRAHLKLYARLLDAHAQGAALDEISSCLFGIDCASDPHRARAVHDAHYARAKWMTEHGYRLLSAEQE